MIHPQYPFPLPLNWHIEFVIDGLIIKAERGNKPIYKTEIYGFDVKYSIITTNGRPIAFETILKILSLFFENEEIIYPQSGGWKGNKMLIKAISDLGEGKSIDEIKENNRLQ